MDKEWDANTQLFHSQVKIRANRNTITSILNSQRMKVQKPKLVEVEFITFFTKLMGFRVNSLPYPNTDFIKAGPCLSYAQKCNLVDIVTEVEIIQVIKGLLADKPTGVDGFL